MLLRLVTCRWKHIAYITPTFTRSTRGAIKVATYPAHYRGPHMGSNQSSSISATRPDSANIVITSHTPTYTQTNAVLFLSIIWSCATRKGVCVQAHTYAHLVCLCVCVCVCVCGWVGGWWVHPCMCLCVSVHVMKSNWMNNSQSLKIPKTGKQTKGFYTTCHFIIPASGSGQTI